MVATFVFTYVYLPETYGRTVEEVQRLVGGGDDEVKQAMEMIHAVECYDFDDDFGNSSSSSGGLNMDGGLGGDGGDGGTLPPRAGRSGGYGGL